MKDLLSRHGLAPLTRLGQHFLVDPGVLRKIVNALDPGPDDTILEIGPGLGTVTRALASRAGQIVAVEVDRGLLKAMAETLDGLANVRVVEGDALKLDLAALVEDSGAVKVVSNLPYYITTPLIFRLLEARPFPRLVIMVQEEVARRLAAGPGEAAYGALTVAVAARYQVRVVTGVGRHAFYPVPGVDSSLLLMLPRPPRDPDPARWALEAVVRAAFGQRRKMLVGALAGGELGLDRPGARRVLEAAGISGTRRGETLSLEEFEDLARALETSPGVRPI
ncbi:MAG: 16S rRNA (adenine(1518)-N(6)/adenine(1519)-N(6))-dimethyltransferase RsmA [bacterium]|nr:16S rRNA (adenine(1518)-N(6)/adenine(1519)-N(6))-dimethyltransferase RsmA [bacterium]